MNTFRQDLEIGRPAELAAINYYRNNGYEVKRPPEDLTGAEIRAYERLYGDFIAKHTSEGTRGCVEVKSDASMNKTKNLFLETLSDNGERTGNVTVGWFNNDETEVSDYIFFNRVNPEKSIKVSKETLKLALEENPSWFRVLKMSYNQQQMNRSEGYVVSINKLLNNYDGIQIINLDNKE